MMWDCFECVKYIMLFWVLSELNGSEKKKNEI